MLRHAETDGGEEPGEVLVFEAEPYWAPEGLQRQLSPDAFIVRLCVRRQDVLSRLRSDASALLVVSLRDHGRDCVELIAQLPRRRVFTLVVASPATAEFECPFREAGVDSFVVDSLSGEELARRIRHVAGRGGAWRGS